MTILTKEQVEALTYKECKTALRALAKAHRLETSWYELTKEERALCDDVGNTLLWLEDRIYRYEDSRVPSMDPTATTLEPIVVKVEKTGPKRRQYRIGDKIYKDVHEASMKTGIKVNTLRTYVGRNPDKYGYVD